MIKQIFGATMALMLGMPVLSAQAANVAVDCTKKASVNVALGKLDRSVANTVTITGTCTEDVVVSAHRDLTIVGNAGAGLIASVLSGNTATNTVTVNGNSRVTLQSLSITGGSQGVYCDDRSTCVLKNIAIQGGQDGGLSVQKQSSADVLDGSIVNSQNNGVGVFGASSVNVRSDSSPNPVQISGHANFGLVVQDGSFARVDGATISSNGTGASADRGAVLKLLGTNVSGNTGDGVIVRASSLQITGSVTNNGNNGIWVRKLGFVAFTPSQGQTVTVTGNAGQSVFCENVTSSTQPTYLLNDPRVTYNNTNCPATNLN
jgi:hypothetical protein